MATHSDNPATRPNPEEKPKAPVAAAVPDAALDNTLQEINNDGTIARDALHDIVLFGLVTEYARQLKASDVEAFDAAQLVKKYQKARLQARYPKMEVWSGIKDDDDDDDDD